MLYHVIRWNVIPPIRTYLYMWFLPCASSGTPTIAVKQCYRTYVSHNNV
jgi:hypothetical protein